MHGNNFINRLQTCSLQPHLLGEIFIPMLCPLYDLLVGPNATHHLAIHATGENVSPSDFMLHLWAKCSHGSYRQFFLFLLKPFIGCHWAISKGCRNHRCFCWTERVSQLRALSGMSKNVITLISEVRQSHQGIGSVLLENNTLLWQSTALIRRDNGSSMAFPA